MPELLAALDAILQEHRRCGELDAGVEPALVWMTCDCGADLVRTLDEPSKDRVKPPDARRRALSLPAYGGLTVGTPRRSRPR
jgi:hypothetical protein